MLSQRFKIQVFLFVLISFSSCFTQNDGSKEQYSNNELIVLDFDNKMSERSMKMSTIVDTILYIPLETNKDCLIGEGYNCVGRKFLVFTQAAPSKISLFDRSGKYIREIGHRGNGPGEYRSLGPIDLSPSEDRIIFSPPFRPGLYEYYLTGEFIQIINTKYPVEMGPFYLNDSIVVVVMARPYIDTPDYSRVVKINLNTQEQVGLICLDHSVINDPEALTPCTNNFYKTSQGVFFRDCTSDTLFNIDHYGVVTPVVKFLISDDLPGYKYSDKTRPETMIYSINILKGYVFCHGDNPQRFHLVHDINNKSSFRLTELTNCLGKRKYPFGLENDLDKLNPYWVFESFIERNGEISEVVSVSELNEMANNSCFKAAKLQGNGYCETISKLLLNKSEYDNPIIRVLTIDQFYTTH